MTQPALAFILEWAVAAIVGVALAIALGLRMLAQTARNEAKAEESKHQLLKSRLRRLAPIEAERLALTILSDPNRFESVSSSAPIATDVFPGIPPLARALLDRYEEIVSLPMGDTRISRASMAQASDGRGTIIGESEFFGNIIVGWNDERVFGDEEEIADNIHHFILILSDTDDTPVLSP